MSAPNFDALRAQRNADFLAWAQKFAEEQGVPLQALRTSFNPDACYCACGTGGPCEHDWTGPDWESEDGRTTSVTCARCGSTAMSHDMRYAP